MTDNDRCKLIAEFEGDPNASHGGTICDYAHDLNATMRAARKLRNHLLIVCGNGVAYISGDGSQQVGCLDDPARAAFLALSSYLENAKT